MTAKKNKTVFLIPLLMLILIAASVLLRIPVYSYVKENGNDSFTDPETDSFYLTEMDSYYHLRMTKDILDHGHAGDTEKDGELWDSLSYAPEGRSAADYRPLMAGIAVCVYRIASLFAEVSIEQVVYWLNTFLSALVVIPVFLLSYELSNIWGAVAASIIAALNYGYFIHTVPGFYDTDGIIMLTSCFFMYFGCMMIKKAASGDKKALILNSTGFLISAIALYNSWYVYYLFVFILAACFFIYAAITYKKGEFKRIAFPAVSSLAFAVIVLLVEPGIIDTVIGTLNNIYSRGVSLFPDTYVSVSEMKKPVLFAGGLTGLFQMKVLSGKNIGIINAAGGFIPCAAALAGLYFVIRSIIKRNAAPEHILLLIWYAITLVLAFRSWRFIMLFALPNAILAGDTAGRICGLMDKGKMMDRGIYKTMLLILMTFPALYGSYRSFSDSVPSVDTQMGNALASIRDNTPEDAVLISWWDYGYLFEDKALRRTLFDGGSQSGIRCYWVAKAFATRNESFSSNIIRMLSGSGDTATKEMLRCFGENKDTLVLMDELLLAGRTEAEDILSQKNIDKQSKDDLLALLYPDSLPEMDCIITPHMSQIADWFAKFGMQAGKETMDASRYVTGLSRMSGPAPSEEKTVYKTGYNFEIVVQKTSYGYTACTRRSENDTTEPYHIGKMIIINENGYTECTPGGSCADTDWCLIMEDHGDNVYISLVTVPLAESVFGKLYFCYGAGLTQFTIEPSLSSSTTVYRVKAD